MFGRIFFPAENEGAHKNVALQKTELKKRKFVRTDVMYQKRLSTVVAARYQMKYFDGRGHESQ